MNIYDISKEAKVSIATVSRVINNAENVNEATRQRVMEVIKRNKYMPNAFAQGLMNNTLRMAGVICGDFSDSNWSKGLNYLEMTMRKFNYSSMMCSTGYDLKKIKRCIDLFLEKKIDALILAGSYFVQEDDQQNEYIRAASRILPVILINAQYLYPNVYSLACGDYHAAYDAATRLYDSGAKRVIYYSNFDCYCSRQKIGGFKKACREHGVNPDEAILHVSSDVTNRVELAVNALVEAHEKGLQFDAVLAEEDLLGVAAVKYAKRMGYAIPDEFQVVGYDNLTYSYCCDPELTSIDSRLETLCSSSVTTLMDVIAGKPVPATQLFAHSIIERGTTRF